MTFNPSEIEQAKEWGLLNRLDGFNKAFSFCQTGTMSVTRQEMSALIHLLGGTCHNAIKSDTSHLIVPNGEFRKGSKYQAALRCGTTIITEKEFCDMIMPSVDKLLEGLDENGAAS